MLAEHKSEQERLISKLKLPADADGRAVFCACHAEYYKSTPSVTKEYSERYYREYRSTHEIPYFVKRVLDNAPTSAEMQAS